jgi:hypothetical protein
VVIASVTSCSLHKLQVVEPHALLQPGNKDGDTKVVKETNGAVNAYAWDAAVRNDCKASDAILNLISNLFVPAHGHVHTTLKVRHLFGARQRLIIEEGIIPDVIVDEERERSTLNVQRCN